MRSLALPDLEGLKMMSQSIFMRSDLLRNRTPMIVNIGFREDNHLRLSPSCEIGREGALKSLPVESAQVSFVRGR